MLFSEIDPFVRYMRYLIVTKNSIYCPNTAFDARFFYTVNGRGTIIANGTPYTMEKGCAIIINAGVEYHLKTSEQTVRYFAVNFDYKKDCRHITTPIPPTYPHCFNTSEIMCPVSFSDILSLNSVAYLKNMTVLEPRCISAEHEFSRKLNFWETVCSNIFSEILLKCARVLKSNELTDNSETIDMILDYIHENHASPLTNAEIGDIFSFHPNYVSKMVRQNTGVPLHKYILNIRIAHAIDMLEAGCDNIGEIAVKCGFQNIYYFSRYFKKATGISPTEYRRKQSCFFGLTLLSYKKSYFQEKFMPIKIPNELPAVKTLENENVFMMTEERAIHQDIRPLKIAIVNIMPTKIETETQLLRLLGNSPLQVEIELIQMASHVSKNTSAEHLLKFYKTFEDIKNERFDGLIITGAPVELMPFEEVEYWDELCAIMDWAKTNVYSTLYICWGSQAGLYYKYGLKKRPLPKKLSGIYWHERIDFRHPLTRGFDDVFLAPHSRYTETPVEDIRKVDDLFILAESEEAGAFIVADRDCRNIFITGHAEYSRHTLMKEYERDVAKGIDPEIPCNYFPDDDPNKEPLFLWRSHANMLYANWLNHIVYLHTPYDLSEL